MIRVVVADDHELVRKGIVALFAAAKDIQVVGEASDGNEAIALVEKLSPDVIIMDISMPRLDGIKALEQIATLPTQVVVLSMHEDEMIVRRVFQVGARGFVLKRAVTEELVNAVHAAHDRRAFLSSGLSPELMDNSADGAASIHELLTTREKEVLQLIAEGNTNNAIAHLLSISVKTVEKHRASCMAKLGVNDVVSLVRVAIRHRLVIIDASGIG